MSNYEGVAAFPASPFATPDGTIFLGQDGISRREYFAAHAPEMPDWYRNSKVHCVTPQEKLALMVSWRWDYADSMIAGRGE